MIETGKFIYRGKGMVPQVKLSTKFGPAVVFIDYGKIVPTPGAPNTIFKKLLTINFMLKMNSIKTGSGGGSAGGLVYVVIKRVLRDCLGQSKNSLSA